MKTVFTFSLMFPFIVVAQNTWDGSSTSTISTSGSLGLGAWKNDQVYFANAWIGVSDGIFTTKIGLGHPQIQDEIQNNLHQSWFKPAWTNFFNRYDNFQQGPYLYSGYNNPFSLWP